MKSVDRLAKKAMELRPTERIRLVEAILYSLDKPDRNVSSEMRHFHQEFSVAPNRFFERGD